MEEQSKSKANIDWQKAAPQVSMLLSVITILLVIVVLYVTASPVLLERYNPRQAVINEVANLTTVSMFESPQIEVIGTGNLSDLDAIVSANEANKQVYENAQDGDYVLAFDSKLVIYRRSTNTIVYEGQSPRQKIQEQNLQIAQVVIDQAVKDGVLSEENSTSEVPTLAVIRDADEFKSNNPEFYSVVENNDILAQFNQAGIIIIYRPDDQKIVKVGSVDTVIK